MWWSFGDRDRLTIRSANTLMIPIYRGEKLNAIFTLIKSSSLLPILTNQKRGEKEMSFQVAINRRIECIMCPFQREMCLLPCKKVILLNELLLNLNRSDQWLAKSLLRAARNKPKLFFFLQTQMLDIDKSVDEIRLILLTIYRQTDRV